MTISTMPNTAFWLKMQQDVVNIVELVDFELPDGTSYHFTSCNQPVLFTLSGTLIEYKPFAGDTPSDVKEDNKLGVSVMNFTLQNTYAGVQGMLDSGDFQNAGLKVGQVHIDTPDLGRMDIYIGQVGDWSHTRVQIKGQARNFWKSINIQWPYYLYQDTCGWRFGSAGCGIKVNSTYGVTISSVNVSSSDTQDILLPTGTLSAYVNETFDFGRLMVSFGTNSGMQRTIRAHTGDLLKLSYDLPNSDFTGMQLFIAPGCRKRFIEDCRSRYNNTLRFLGWPWIPIEEDAY